MLGPEVTEVGSQADSVLMEVTVRGSIYMVNQSIRNKGVILWCDENKERTFRNRDSCACPYQKGLRRHFGRNPT